MREAFAQVCCDGRPKALPLACSRLRFDVALVPEAQVARSAPRVKSSRNSSSEKWQPARQWSQLCVSAHRQVFLQWPEISPIDQGVWPWRCCAGAYNPQRPTGARAIQRGCRGQQSYTSACDDYNWSMLPTHTFSLGSAMIQTRMRERSMRMARQAKATSEMEMRFLLLGASRGLVGSNRHSMRLCSPVACHP